jgi:hypothetical protein
VKAALGITGVGGAMTVLADAGSPGLICVGFLIVAIVFASCWVLASTPRTERLVSVIRALRMTPSPPARRKRTELPERHGRNTPETPGLRGGNAGR